jgi:hypothetical protein
MPRVPGWAAAPVFVAALAVVAMAGNLLADPVVAEVAPPTTVPVESSRLVCPAPIASGTKVETVITLADAALGGLPPAPADRPPGEAGIGRLAAADFVPQRTLSEPGTADGFRVQGT